MVVAIGGFGNGKEPLSEPRLSSTMGNHEFGSSAVYEVSGALKPPPKCEALQGVFHNGSKPQAPQPKPSRGPSPEFPWFPLLTKVPIVGFQGFQNSSPSAPAK